MFKIVSYDEKTNNAEIKLFCEYCGGIIEKVDDGTITSVITRYDGHSLNVTHKGDCAVEYKENIQDVFKDDVVFGHGELKEFLTDIYNEYCTGETDVGETP